MNMKPGEIWYAKVKQDDGSHLMEPLEILGIATVKTVDETGKKGKAEQVTVKARTGAVLEVWADQLTKVPFLPDIEKQIRSKESRER
jgi:hypothetical protein